VSRSLKALGIAVVALASLTVLVFALGAGEPDPQGGRREGPPVVVAKDNEVAEDIVGVGQSIEIVGRVRGGVLALGGDVYVTGVVDGDVAAVGGSVLQTGGSRIGGDVLVVGGAYDQEAGRDGRVDGKNTLIFAGDPASIRSFFANPTREVLAPEIDRAFVGWRVAAALMSFLVSLLIVAVAPRAVSRTSERLAEHSLRIAVIGLLGTAAVLLLAGVALRLLSAPLAALVLVPLLSALLAAQLFGRVVAYLIVGRWLQRRLFRDRSRSQAVALLLGVLSIAFLGSLPIVGALVLFATFILSTGIVLTASRGAEGTIQDSGFTTH
jgi:hypothetical protein